MQRGLDISRVGRPGGFRYVDKAGRSVRDAATLARIRKLAIPPGWRNVRIASSPRARVQATGIDAKGRLQYRYDPNFRAAREQAKYATLLSFSTVLPRLRRRVERDLRQPGLTREKVLAACVRVLETTHIRVGNEAYRETNRSFGLTTLLDRHARVKGGAIKLRFRGKSGKDHDLTFRDPRLAEVVAACRDLPGQDLFQYVGADGRVHDVKSEDINGYLHDATGGAFTAKTFRTWTGSVLALAELRAREAPVTKTAAKREVAAAVRAVAAHLGNTPSVCRRSYVHPAVIDGYVAGRLQRVREARARGLSKQEAALVAFLRAGRR